MVHMRGVALSILAALALAACSGGGEDPTVLPVGLDAPSLVETFESDDVKVWHLSAQAAEMPIALKGSSDGGWIALTVFPPADDEQAAPSDSTDLALRRFDSQGRHKWSASLEVPGGLIAALLEVDTTDAAYVAVQYLAEPGTNMIVEKVAAGAVAWTAAWTVESSTVFEDMVVTPDGQVWLAGVSTDKRTLLGSSAEARVVVERLDGEGDRLGRSLLSPGTNVRSPRIAVTGEGVVYVGGAFANEAPDIQGGFPTDVFLSRLDSGGAAIWTRELGTPQADVVTELSASPSGNLYFLGATFGVLDGHASHGNLDAYLMRLDADGDLVWGRQFGTGFADRPLALAIGGDGSAYVADAGYVGRVGDDVTQPFALGGGAVVPSLRKFREDGSADWAHTLSPIAPVRIITNMAATSSGDLVLAGLDATGEDSVGVYGRLAGSAAPTALPSATDYLATLPAEPIAQEWTRQFTSYFELSSDALAIDEEGGVYSGGLTSVPGRLPGMLSPGAEDAFVMKHDAQGRLQWWRQFGTSGPDGIEDAAWRSDGTLVVAGWTRGPIGGQEAKELDGFVRAYDAGGDELWTTQFGSSSDDSLRGMALGSDGSIYVVGAVGEYLETDAFIYKLGSDGSLLWSDEFGTPQYDVAVSVVERDSSVYVVGHTEGSFGGAEPPEHQQMFVQKRSADGDVLWTRVLTLSTVHSTYAAAAAVTREGDIVVAGYTFGPQPGETERSDQNALVAKLRHDGDTEWVVSIGDERNEEAEAIAILPDGSILVGGNVRDRGSNNGGLEDPAFLARLSPGGEVQRCREFGSDGYDSVTSIVMDPAGAIYLGGNTQGTLPGQESSGWYDGFVLRASGVETLLADADAPSEEPTSGTTGSLPPRSAC